jgi:uncharacterized protein
MNLPRKILDRFAQRHSAMLHVPLRVSNLTRQTELAHCVDVADRGAKRRKGLLGREMLAVGEGLWIVPCEAVHTFGMRFPIDLVYLDRDKRVKKIRSDVRSWRISSCLSAHSVLELASGSIQKTRTKPGDLLEFSSAFPLSDDRISLEECDPTLSKPGDKRGSAMLAQRKNLRGVGEFLVVAICTLAFAITAVGIFASLLGSKSAGSRDFVQYWAAGHQLIHHANPYDRATILPMERAVGFPSGLPAFIMPNPPSALLLVLPLGFLGPVAAELVWLALLLACLVASVRMVWIMHGRPKNQLHWLGYSFAPALSCLLSGQVTIFLLLGLALFLRFHRSRPFLAGVSLWLCMLKPHLFLPFGVVLIVWVILTRSYKILVGTVVALGVSSAVALMLDPLVWVQYGQMMSTARINRLVIPCLSIMLRQKLSPNTIWLQYLPAVLGCVWALTYFRRHRDDWDWIEHGSLLMLVSLLFAPYTWFMDQAILIPALLHAAYVTRSRNLLAVLALASAIIEIAILRGLPLLQSVFYLWTAPGWLVWYLCATRATVTPPSNAYDLSLVVEGREATP